MNLSKLSQQQRIAIALGASLGVSHTAFRIFDANFGAVTGIGLGLLFTFGATYAIYWAMGLPLKKNARLS
jgi:hypothetical protein